MKDPVLGFGGRNPPITSVRKSPTARIDTPFLFPLEGGVKRIGVIQGMVTQLGVRIGGEARRLGEAKQLCLGRVPEPDV